MNMNLGMAEDEQGRANRTRNKDLPADASFVSFAKTQR
jgi:hypothetical protein